MKYTHGSITNIWNNFNSIYVHVLENNDQILHSKYESNGIQFQCVLILSIKKINFIKELKGLVFNIE